MQDIKIRKFKDILFYSLIFWLIAHGYRFANNLHTGDTLGSVFQDDIWWQRSLGRFMQTFSMVFRGVIVSPWLLAVISVVFFAGGVYLISEILGIEDRFIIFVVCGILSCNVTVTCALAAYTPWIDIYMTAFFLAMLGIWFFTKDKLHFYVLGMISLALSMGFYQAYICTAFVMIAIIYILKLTDTVTDKKFWMRTLRIAACILLSGGMYLVLYKLVLKVHHVNEAMSYNSLSNMGIGKGEGLGSLLAGTYERYVYYLTHQGTFVSTYLMARKVSDVWDVLIIVCVAAVAVILIAGLAVICRKKKPSVTQIVLIILLIVLLPLFSNVIYILSNGMEHELMVYALNFLFVLCAAVIAKLAPGKVRTVLLMIPMMIIIWHAIVFSNQVYLKVDMEDRAALSVATRIADDLNGTEGYVPGETPVRVIGSLQNSQHYDPVIYLRDVNILGNFDTPFTLENSFPFYMSHYLNERINFSNEEIPAEVLEVMPEYPEKGSIAFVGDTLVIKLSD